MANEDLIIRIGAVSDQFTDELNKIKKQTKNLESQLATIAKISGVAFAGLTAAAGVAVKDFIKFDNELRGVKTLLNESSFGAKGLEKGFNDLKKEVLDLGSKTPVALSSLNKSLFDTISAGVDASKAIGVLEASSQLAVAGLTDVSIATDGVTSALNAYGISADQADVVASKFFAAQVAGKTTIAELSSFFGRAGATASAYGVSLDELLSSVSAVTTGGVKTAAAFTGLNAVLANIAKPTADAQKEAERLGISFDSTSLRTKGLAGFLEELTTAQGFTKESVEQLFGSVEAQKIVFALTGAQADKFKETLKSLGDETKSTATFQKAYATQSQSLENQIKNLNGALQTIRIEIGELLAPTVASIVKTFSSFADTLRNLTDEQKQGIATALKFAIGLTGLVTAAATLGVAFVKAAAIVKTLGAAFAVIKVAAAAAFAAITAPVGLIVGGLAAVGVGVAALMGVFKKDEKPKSLENINKELDDLKKKQEEIKNQDKSSIPIVQAYRSQKLKGIQDEIAELERLKLKQEESRKFEGGVGLGADKAKEVAAVKDNEDKKTEIVAAETLKRRQIAQDDLAIARAEAEGKTQEEIAFLQRRQDIKDGFREAEKIKDAEEAALVKETLNLRREELLADEQAFFERKNEQQKLFDETLSQLDEEKQALLKDARTQKEQEEINAIINQGVTKRDIDRKLALDELKEKQKSNARYLEDQKKFGTAYAMINQAMNSAIFQGNKQAFSDLAQLQQSSNNTLKGIGKVAAIANIVIKTAESAMNVYAGFSTIPIIGPALGIAGAAAAVAFGAEQVGKVKGAKDGALVTGGLKGVDSNPFMLARGELVAPDRSFDEVVEGTARQRGFTKGDEGSMSNELLREISEKLDNVQGGTVINGDVLAEETFIDTLIEKINERIEFGNAQLRT